MKQIILLLLLSAVLGATICDVNCDYTTVEQALGNVTEGQTITLLTNQDQNIELNKSIIFQCEDVTIQGITVVENPDGLVIKNCEINGNIDVQGTAKISLIQNTFKNIKINVSQDANATITRNNMGLTKVTGPATLYEEPPQGGNYWGECTDEENSLGLSGPDGFCDEAHGSDLFPCANQDCEGTGKPVKALFGMVFQKNDDVILTAENSYSNYGANGPEYCSREGWPEGLCNVSWDLGNGYTYEDELEVTTTYPKNGLYYVTLDTTLYDNRTDTQENMTDVVVVAVGVPPVAQFTANPRSGAALPEDIVTFDASLSYDPDNKESANQGVYKYYWDFGNGEGFEEKNSPTITHKFKEKKIEYITLIVKDSDELLGMIIMPFGVGVKVSSGGDLVAESVKMASQLFVGQGTKMITRVCCQGNMQCSPFKLQFLPGTLTGTMDEIEYGSRLRGGTCIELSSDKTFSADEPTNYVFSSRIIFSTENEFEALSLGEQLRNNLVENSAFAAPSLEEGLYNLKGSEFPTPILVVILIILPLFVYYVRSEKDGI